MRFNINQLLPQETCLKCDGCCRYSQETSIWQPALLDTEIKILCNNSSFKDISTSSEKIKTSPFKEYFICALFDVSNNRCKIYNNRPFECRLYPFLINKTKKTVYLAVDLRCPFIKDKLEDQAFKDYTNYLNNFLNLPDISLVLRKNLRIFSDYAEASVKNLSILAF